MKPEYDTDPKYFVAGANPENVRSIVPVAPVVAAAGAFTVMLPVAVDPSSHENSVKLAEPGREAVDVDDVTVGQ